MRDGAMVAQQAHNLIDESSILSPATMIQIFRKEGWTLTPDDKRLNNIMKAIERNNGNCPCTNDSEDPKCPCSNYREKDKCCCGLYVKKQ